LILSPIPVLDHCDCIGEESDRSKSVTGRDAVGIPDGCRAQPQIHWLDGTGLESWGYTQLHPRLSRFAGPRNRPPYRPLRELLDHPFPSQLSGNGLDHLVKERDAAVRRRRCSYGTLISTLFRGALGALQLEDLLSELGRVQRSRSRDRVLVTPGRWDIHCAGSTRVAGHSATNLLVFQVRIIV
jgi:hypothetical protein